MGEKEAGASRAMVAVDAETNKQRFLKRRSGLFPQGNEQVRHISTCCDS
jgi:hypothetical protein